MHNTDWIIPNGVLPRFTEGDTFTVYADTRPDTFRMLVEDEPDPTGNTLLLARDGSLILVRWFPYGKRWSAHVSVPLFPPF